MQIRFNDFINAVQAGNLDEVNIKISFGINVNQVVKNGYSALELASWKGHFQIVRALLEAKAQVNPESEQYETSLELAASHGHLEIVNLLIHAGITHKVNQRINMKVLEMARRLNKWEVVSILEYFQLNQRNIQLMEAAKRGNDSEVRALVLEKADVNFQHYAFYQTPLMLASASGRDETVIYLLEQKAEINYQDTQYNTALTLAAFYGHNTTVELLLYKNADIELEGTAGSALKRALNNEITNKINSLEENKKPSGYKLYNEDESILKILLFEKYKAAVRSFFLKGSNISKDLVKIIISYMELEFEYSDFINATWKHNLNQELIEAIKESNKEHVDNLLKKGADINHLNFLNETPLTVAVCTGVSQIVELLLRKNANFYLKGSNGLTALEWAVKNKYQNVVHICQEHQYIIEKIKPRLTKYIFPELLNDISKENVLMLASMCQDAEILRNVLTLNPDINYQIIENAISSRNDEAVFIIENHILEKHKAILSNFIYKDTIGLVVDYLQLKLNLGQRRINRELIEPSSLITCDTSYYVAFLLRQGADINFQDPHYSGNTALTWHCAQGNANYVNILLEAKADINDCNEKGINPLRIAISQGHQKMVTLLLEKNAILTSHEEEQSEQVKNQGFNGKEIAEIVKLHKYKKTKETVHTTLSFFSPSKTNVPTVIVDSIMEYMKPMY